MVLEYVHVYVVLKPHTYLPLVALPYHYHTTIPYGTTIPRGMVLLVLEYVPCGTIWYFCEIMLHVYVQVYAIPWYYLVPLGMAIPYWSTYSSTMISMVATTGRMLPVCPYYLPEVCP